MNCTRSAYFFSSRYINEKEEKLDKPAQQVATHVETFPFATAAKELVLSMNFNVYILYNPCIFFFTHSCVEMSVQVKAFCYKAVK